MSDKADLPEFAKDLWDLVLSKANGESGDVVLTSLYAAIETVVQSTIDRADKEKAALMRRSVMAKVSEHNLTMLKVLFGVGGVKSNDPRQ